MQNTLYTHDNLYVLNGINSEIADLIYLDPPFNSKLTYSAPVGTKAAGTSFKDMWTWKDVDEAYLENIVDKYPLLVGFINSIEESHSKAMKAYVTYMTQRLIQLHRILKETGSIYLHCDPTASHYLKILMDFIFGRDNFRNEITWERDHAGRGAKKHSGQLPRNADILLFYSKNYKKCYFQQSYTTKLEHKTLKEFRYEEEGGRKFKIVTLGDYSPQSIERMRQEGLIYKTKNDTEYKKYYLNEFRLAVGSIWSDIPNLSHGRNKEATGYATQKPLALLHRIIKASCPEGCLVLDPFCGCATTCVAAQQLGRKWIGIDIEKQAVNLLIERLEGDGFIDESTNIGLKFKEQGVDFIHLTQPQQRTDIPQIPPTDKPMKERLFKEQNGKCKACDVEMRIVDFEVDHIIPKAKGGGDYYENYQLLCGNCNITKGARPM